MALFSKKDKVFCIGRNKTGTTSLERVLKNFGYNLGNQPSGELLLEHYKIGNFKPIVKFCKTAEAFQDAPFSWPNTWLFLYQAYPNAKFILTYRDSEKWYKSISSFHSKMFADGVRTPTMEDLKGAGYRYPGFVWESNRAVWKTPTDDVYCKEEFIRNYENHNDSVRHFFKEKSNFIAINVSRKEDYLKLCTFLEKEPIGDDFPHLNKT